MFLSPVRMACSAACRALQEIAFANDFRGLGPRGQEGNRMRRLLQDFASLLGEGGPQLCPSGTLANQDRRVLARVTVVRLQVKGRVWC